jgi:hypothetical protein
MKKILCSSLFIVFVFAGNALGFLSIEPAIIDHDMSEGRASGTIEVTNTGNSEYRFRARVLEFLLDEWGQPTEIESHDRSLGQYIKFNPKEFTLEPGTSRSIRYSIIPRAFELDGEYWAGLEFEPLVPMKSQEVGGEESTANVQIIAVVMVPIFCNMGEATYSAELSNLEVSQNASGIDILSTLRNTGNARFRGSGEYEIVDKSGNTVCSGSLSGGTGTVLPELSRNFTATCETPLPSGGYTVRVRHSCDKSDDVVAAETDFMVAAGD